MYHYASKVGKARKEQKLTNFTEKADPRTIGTRAGRRKNKPGKNTPRRGREGKFPIKVSVSSMWKNVQDCLFFHSKELEQERHCQTSTSSSTAI